MIPMDTTPNNNADYDRFKALWQRCLLNDAVDQHAAIYQQLVAAYGEPQRVYHTLEHIGHCLSMLDSAHSLLECADAVELAIWFHDVVYQPGSRDNEQLSADQFMAHTEGVFDDTLREMVYQHIMATLHCGSAVNVGDAAFMVDIDLSSFGLLWPDFLRDSTNVRKEMTHMSDAEFYPKQTAFQRLLLDQPRFFQSDYFYEKYEVQARKNLAEYFELTRQRLAD